MLYLFVTSLQTFNSQYFIDFILIFIYIVFISMFNKLYFIFILFFASNGFAQKSTFKTHYRTFGKGQPIVIINGGPGMNSNGFAGVAEQIAQMGFQTIIYDQRGTGKSQLDSLNNQTITMDLMAEDLEKLRKELNLTKWTVMGHSFGGLLASHYFAKYPASVERLIFSSSGGVNMKFVSYVQDRLMNNLTSQQRDSLTFYQNKMQKGDTTYQTRLKRAGFLANAYVFDKTHAPKIASRLMEISLNINGLVFQDLNKIKYDYTNQFTKTNIPVLVIQGTNDIISVETAKEIKQSFGNAQIQILEKCAHYGWLDKPEEYFNALKQFLTKPIQMKEFIYVLKLTEKYQDEKNWTEETGKILGEHFNYLKDFYEKGISKMIGRTDLETSNPNMMGLNIFIAESLEAAQEMANNDPAVKNGIMRAEVLPFKIVLGQK